MLVGLGNAAFLGGREAPPLARGASAAADVEASAAAEALGGGGPAGGASAPEGEGDLLTAGSPPAALAAEALPFGAASDAFFDASAAGSGVPAALAAFFGSVTIQDEPSLSFCSSTLWDHFCKKLTASVSPHCFKLKGTFHCALNSSSSSESGSPSLPCCSRVCNIFTMPCTIILAKGSPDFSPLGDAAGAAPVLARFGSASPSALAVGAGRLPSAAFGSTRAAFAGGPSGAPVAASAPPAGAAAGRPLGTCPALAAPFAWAAAFFFWSSLR
mmetsp:Transcript_67528/g.162107  ORF Transcript_67528/g.162107 Transcript_67528/m.162107 type:complete len:272 (-) Transcript_67528:383-1198(-)